MKRVGFASGMPKPENDNAMDQTIRDAARVMDELRDNHVPSINFPLGRVTRTGPWSPSSADIDRELQDLHRFCQNIRQNTFLSELEGRSERRATVGGETTENHSTDTRSVGASTNTGRQSLNSGTRPTSRGPLVQTTPEAFIDLSDVATPRYNRSIPFNNNTDVVVVPDLDTVNLCTPELIRTPLRTATRQQQEQRQRVRSRSPQLNSRRSLNESLPVLETVDQIPPRSDRNDVLICPVCMENMLPNQPTSTKCGHVFCKNCICHALRVKHKCPMCNTKITARSLFRLYL